MSEVSKEKPLIVIRQAVQDDYNFLIATMLRGLFYGDSWFSLIPKNIFMSCYHGVIDRLLTSPAATINVACLQEDPSVILGYAIQRKVGDKVALDFVFVKKIWRGIGIAKSLVNPDTSIVTHLTKAGLAAKPKHWDFNPFAL